jgi:hypothetical protein
MGFVDKPGGLIVNLGGFRFAAIFRPVQLAFSC